MRSWREKLESYLRFEILWKIEMKLSWKAVHLDHVLQASEKEAPPGPLLRKELLLQLQLQPFPQLQLLVRVRVGTLICLFRGCTTKTFYFSNWWSKLVWRHVSDSRSTSGCEGFQTEYTFTQKESPLPTEGTEKSSLFSSRGHIQISEQRRCFYFGNFDKNIPMERI
jgi:hypothetical protein